MPSTKKIIPSLLLFFPFLANAQCAMCRAVLESSGDQGRAEALNEGIMYLMVWPYLLIGGLGFFAWWSLRRQMKKSDENTGL